MTAPVTPVPTILTIGAHNVYYVKLPVKILYFTIHIHTQINQYVVISDFPPVSVEKHRIVMLQGDRRHAGTPEDGVISREQIAQVLVTALSNDAAKNKTFELVAERGEAQQDLTPLFAELRNDNPQKNDGVFDIDNMPLTEEPECVINDLNLYSKNSKI